MHGCTCVFLFNLRWGGGGSQSKQIVLPTTSEESVSMMFQNVSKRTFQKQFKDTHYYFSLPFSPLPMPFLLLSVTLQPLFLPFPPIPLFSLPPSEYSLDQLEKLLVLLLGCAVKSEPLVEKMKSMEAIHQKALVANIKQVTHSTELVCSIDWDDLNEIPKQ